MQRSGLQGGGRGRLASAGCESNKKRTMNKDAGCKVEQAAGQERRRWMTEGQTGRRTRNSSPGESRRGCAIRGRCSPSPCKPSSLPLPLLLLPAPSAASSTHAVLPLTLQAATCFAPTACSTTAFNCTTMTSAGRSFANSRPREFERGSFVFKEVPSAGLPSVLSPPPSCSPPCHDSCRELGPCRRVFRTNHGNPALPTFFSQPPTLEPSSLPSIPPGRLGFHPAPAAAIQSRPDWNSPASHPREHLRFVLHPWCNVAEPNSPGHA